MIALDTNILVYAHREEAPEHTRALHWMSQLARSGAPWGVPLFVLGEFVRVVTHLKVLDPPTSMDDALTAVEELVAAPGVRLLAGGPRFAEHFVAAVKVGRATGNLAFDAQIAAVCREHGISRLLTRDRDFSRFPWIQIVDPDDDPKAVV